ncbi:unnamed protein product [Gongylonema pulchrum]|uniref:Uncharacterized protein n=1 Tax=Gongylonema pulchrum TaxID=637853 RepID=A0A183E672_9BILA|nr:unnamed protein product [Gongylonema pulchrum]
MHGLLDGNRQFFEPLIANGAANHHLAPPPFFSGSNSVLQNGLLQNPDISQHSAQVMSPTMPERNSMATYEMASSGFTEFSVYSATSGCCACPLLMPNQQQEQEQSQFQQHQEQPLFQQQTPQQPQIVTRKSYIHYGRGTCVICVVRQPRSYENLGERIEECDAKVRSKA